MIEINAETTIVNMETDTNILVPLDIKVGYRFRDLEEFECNLKKQCKSKFVQLYKKDARTIQSAKNKKITRYLDPALKFYSVCWCCVHGGRKFQTRGQGKRKTPTLRKECPAYIQVRIAESGVEFIVVGVNFKHNHIVLQELFKQLPQNRRLPDDVKADIKKILNLKVNKRMLREDLEKKLCQTVTLKDLSNLQQVSKSRENDIESITKLIKTKFGADCHVLMDENNIFKGLFFSSQEMIKSLIAYPETIFLDATFKLSAIKASVYIILNVDGNGESDIVAISILMSEDKESLKWFLQSFKDSLPPETADKIQNVMTDNDLTQRDILRLTFPKIKLHICVFHVLKIFKNEISCEKFLISSSDKLLILELLQKLVYSASEKKFFDLIDQIKRKSVRVYEYLKENWINIKEEWCPYLGKKFNNFMNTTNNRLEGIKAKLKAVIDKHISLEEFINNLLTTRDCLNKEKNIRIANRLNKRSICSTVNDFQYEYLKLLTPYAFEKLKMQFSFQNLSFAAIAESAQFYNMQHEGLQLQVTPDSCTCYFNNSMGLPCNHIFAVRQHNNQNLFDPALIPDRWKMNYFMDNCRFFHQKEVEAPATSSIDDPLHVDTFIAESRKKAMTSKEKYRKTFIKAKLMASLACDLCEDKYNNVNNIIDAIINDLQNGENSFVASALSLIALTSRNDLSTSRNEESSIHCVQEATMHTSEVVEVAINPDQYITPPQNFPEASTTDNKEILIGNDIRTSNDIQLQLNENINITKKTLLFPNVQKIDGIERKAKGKKSNVNTNNDKTNNEISNEFKEHNIKVPICKKRGRPTGSDITVIGITKRKKKSQKLVPFSKKPTKERLYTMFKWILKDAEVVNIRQIEENDLLPIERIDIRILEVDLTILKKFFSLVAWNLLKNFKSRLKMVAKWKCNYCRCDITGQDPTIYCDFCLHWQHIRCAGTTTVASGLFMCANCK